MQSLTSFLAGSVIALIMAVPASAQPFSDTTKIVETKTNGIHYAAGGVGLDARDEMRRLAATHNVLVMFTESGGEFLVPDAIAVRKGNVDVLNMNDSGPLLYVNLPNGAYTVQATYKGVVRSKAINVAGRTPDVVLSWPSQAN